MHVEHDMMKITAPGNFPGGFAGFPFGGPPGPHGPGPNGVRKLLIFSLYKECNFLNLLFEFFFQILKLFIVKAC
jgi:hypothetical protein